MVFNVVKKLLNCKKSMRLKSEEILHIKSLALKHFGRGARVYIFGSRVYDTKRGGDIDIYIETHIKKDILERKLKFLVELKKEIGERKIDTVINNY